ncbi:hypothetical protein IM538_03950 [Cytobacillus suaedae]|nr:hypothetical protein IM538_03950 [Cytobacillus suaedae]
MYVSAIRTCSVTFMLLYLMSGCSSHEVSTPVSLSEVDLELAQEQVAQYQQLISEKEKEIHKLKKMLTNQEDVIAKHHVKILQLEETLNKDFSLINGFMITLKSNINIKELPGVPVSEELIELKGDGFTGSFQKKVSYEDFDIVLFSPDGQFYWIQEIHVDSRAFQTFRGIRVGDSTEVLKDAYPNASLAEDGVSTEYNGIYELKSHENRLNFSVKDGKITGISLVHDIP